MVDLQDPEQGPLRLAIVISKDGSNDGWGEMMPVIGTPWEVAVRPVSGEALSHALHGFATPLVRELGPEPKVIAKRIAQPCALSTGDQCAGARAVCRPGPKMPECYEAPGLSLEATACAAALALALKENRHIIRVIGSEFVLR